LNLFYKVILLYNLLLSGNPGDGHADAIFHITRTNFKAHRHTAHFIFIEFPAWPHICTIIHSDTDACLLQLSEQFIRPSYYGVARLRRTDWNDHNLLRRHFRRQSKTAVIAMNHDEGADQARADAP